jgi:hypothetical protein
MQAFDISKLEQLQSAFDQSGRRTTEKWLAPRVANPINRALDQTPFFSNMSAAGQWVICTIHGVIDLYSNILPGDVEFYLGRCGATPEHVFGRFTAHLENRDHTDGIVSLRCDTRTVCHWETVAIRVLNGLRLRRRLCVANIACHGGGGIPSVDESVMYLTWRLLPKTEAITPAVRRDVDVIAALVATQMAGRTTAKAIAAAIDPITRPVRDRLDLDWARGHVR